MVFVCTVRVRVKYFTIRRQSQVRRSLSRNALQKKNKHEHENIIIFAKESNRNYPNYKTKPKTVNRSIAGKRKKGAALRLCFRLFNDSMGIMESNGSIRFVELYEHCTNFSTKKKTFTQSFIKSIIHV